MEQFARLNQSQKNAVIAGTVFALVIVALILWGLVWVVGQYNDWKTEREATPINMTLGDIYTAPDGWRLWGVYGRYSYPQFLCIPESEINEFNGAARVVRKCDPAAARSDE